MIFTVSIDCENDAFDGAPLVEVARIIESLAQRLRRFSDETTWLETLVDNNGNRVGTARTDEARPEPAALQAEEARALEIDLAVHQDKVNQGPQSRNYAAALALQIQHSPEHWK